MRAFFFNKSREAANGFPRGIGGINISFLIGNFISPDRKNFLNKIFGIKRIN